MIKKPATKSDLTKTFVTAKSKLVTPEPEPDEEETQVDEAPFEEEEETEAAPPRFQARAPQRPAQQEERGKLRFPEGSLFEGDRDSKVLFAGTFHPDELHSLIELAREESTDSDKVRVKIFDVDDEYQKNDKHRVRITFCGLQKPRPQQRGGQSGGWQKKKW